MKRKILCILLSTTIVFSFCSCGNTEQKEDNSTAETSINHYFVDGKKLTEEEYNAYLAQQEQQQEKTPNRTEEKTTVDATEDSTKEIEQAESILEINIGDTFTLSDGTNELEITLTSVDLQQEVHSLVEDTNMFSKYYADQDGETYVVMKLDIKNLGGANITDDVFEGYNSEKRAYNKILLTFDDKYNYRLVQLDTKSIVMSKYWNLAPLKSQAVYFLQSVPDEIIDKPFIITFSLAKGDTICRYTKK
ncbi:MAG: hypothetical protein J1D89_02425 [Agathobacter sp.]|nr:hypothetical protein [Agathobacter sp.]